ncbi:MAG: hypothetical protein ACK5JR_17850 [Tropicimonas sp.]|uniref:hypothetical protein n=1 Tax=Tropicimonas sp. TaxID=2067044 RepID=UPI003A8909B6
MARKYKETRMSSSPTAQESPPSRPKSSRRHHQSDMYAICRKAADGAGQQAWIVRLSRGGRSFQTTFSGSCHSPEIRTFAITGAGKRFALLHSAKDGHERAEHAEIGIDDDGTTVVAHRTAKGGSQ